MVPPPVILLSEKQNPALTDINICRFYAVCCDIMQIYNKEDISSTGY